MFTRLTIPTPFRIGPVNAYLAGRTLVDPGPGTEDAWAALLDALERRELGPADVERVLVTHPHPDHFGLASRLRERGARVVASPTTAEIVRDFADRLDHEQRFFADFFERNGMTAATAETVTDLPESFLAVAPGVETDREVDDGETISVDDVAVTAEAVQGHAPGETVFTFETAGEARALVGDHVLAEITPNPLLQPPAEDGGDRPRVLSAYNRSLERLADRGFDRLLPGHRDEIVDPTDRIREILRAHEDRTGTVQDLVTGPTTAADVMHGLFDDLPATEYFPAMSEAVGHLDVLEERGAVEKQTQDGVVIYEGVEA